MSLVAGYLEFHCRAILEVAQGMTAHKWLPQKPSNIWSRYMYVVIHSFIKSFGFKSLKSSNYTYKCFPSFYFCIGSTRDWSSTGTPSFEFGLLDLGTLLSLGIGFWVWVLSLGIEYWVFQKIIIRLSASSPWYVMRSQVRSHSHKWVQWDQWE